MQDQEHDLQKTLSEKKRRLREDRKLKEKERELSPLKNLDRINLNSCRSNEDFRQVYAILADTLKGVMDKDHRDTLKLYFDFVKSAHKAREDALQGEIAIKLQKALKFLINLILEKIPAENQSEVKLLLKKELQSLGIYDQFSKDSRESG